MNEILNNSVSVIATLTLNELAAAYEISLNTVSDLETLFEYIKSDYENHCYELLFKGFD